MHVIHQFIYLHCHSCLSPLIISDNLSNTMHHSLQSVLVWVCGICVNRYIHVVFAHKIVSLITARAQAGGDVT
jgi:RNase P subunit RPR2